MTHFPLSIAEAADRLRDGSLTSVGLTEAALARAEAHDELLGVYLARFDESALAAAKQADEELASGRDRGLLHGIPIGVKDIIAAADGPTTAQSLILDQAWGAGKDAPVVARLKAAGAVLTGKLTTMEFAIGMPDRTKPFPLPRNPWDPTTWPGGSSSGTGAGVAAGFVLGGLGTDTGGSIRIPAAFCGITGLMPTFGRVPKSGCAPLGYSLDHIGPMARTARDCAAMLGIIAGYHPSDPDCVDVPVDEYLPHPDASLEGLRIGVDRVHHFPDSADPAVGPAFEAAIAQLERCGASVVEVELPYFQEMVAIDMLTMFSEALAYHMNDLRQRWDEYFAATRAMVARGAFVSGADFVQAQRVRRVGLRALAEVYRTVDIVATPTAGSGAPSYDSPELSGEMDAERLFGTIFTPYWDPTGYPVVVAPMGFTADELPISIQLAARPFEEATALATANAYQEATDWHRRVPPLVGEIDG